MKRLSEAGGMAISALAQEEFDTAQRTYLAYPSSNDCGVVKPYRLVPDKGLLFFEYVEGQNASDLLLKVGTDEQVIVLEKMGTWLRRFHDATRPSAGRADLQERLESLQARLKDGYPSSAVFGRAMAYLKCEAEGRPKISCQHVGLHGDCKPDNFLVRGGQVVGVDIAWKHRNIAEFDLGQFLAQLGLFACSIRGRRLSGSIQGLETAFLRGYGVPSSDSIRLITWMKVYCYLSCWLSWREAGYLQRIWWDIYFAVLLRGSLKELAKAS